VRPLSELIYRGDSPALDDDETRAFARRGVAEAVDRVHDCHAASCSRER
jgi:hypothetical protein